MAASPVTAHAEPASPTPLHTHPVRRSAWSLFLAGMGFAGLLLLIGFLTLWWFSGWETHFVDADAKRVEFRQKTLADRQAEDYKLLHDAPTWFAKDKGMVRVPLDQAIALTIPTLQADKPHAAYPISQSPPQPAAAPTSPDKGAGTSAPGNNAVNPPASNPTVGQPSPAPAAPAPTAAPATAATPTPAPAATPVASVAPPANNNANNPGNPPVPGTNVQPPAPTPEVAPTLAPNSGATAAPMATPVAQPTPVGVAPTGATTPTPAPNEPGASPAGTP